MQPMATTEKPNDRAQVEAKPRSFGHQTYGHHTQVRDSWSMGETHADGLER